MPRNSKTHEDETEEDTPLSERLEVHYNKLKYADREEFDGMFSTITPETRYTELLVDNKERNRIIPDKPGKEEDTQTYLANILEKMKEYYKSGGKMSIRNIMNGKSYAKATMEPYLSDIANLQELMVNSVDSEETRKLTKLVLGALTHLVKGNSSAGDEEKLREFSRNVKPLLFSDKTFMSDCALLQTQLEENSEAIINQKGKTKEVMKFIFQCITNVAFRDRLNDSRSIKDLRNTSMAAESIIQLLLPLLVLLVFRRIGSA